MARFMCQKKLDKVVEIAGGGCVINGAYPIWFLSICTFSSYPGNIINYF